MIVNLFYILCMKTKNKGQKSPLFVNFDKYNQSKDAAKSSILSKIGATNTL